MIGTHDSVTGERGSGWLSWLVAPFACTQGKTVVEQYEAGARFFDFRIKKTRRGWVGAHGLWTTKEPFGVILARLAMRASDDVWVSITLENGNENEGEFMEFVRTFREAYGSIPHVRFVSACVKLPIWRVVESWDAPVGVLGVHHCFKTLDGSSWHTYLPIPWLWNKIYKIDPIRGSINSYDFL